jgi:hypothetical protein
MVVVAFDRHESAFRDRFGAAVFGRAVFGVQFTEPLVQIWLRVFGEAVNNFRYEADRVGRIHQIDQSIDQP